MELLVRVRDKVNPKDATLDLLCLKRGDVVHAAKDGHAWTQAEIENPDWRILKLPDMTADDARSYLAAEKPAGLDKQYVLRTRAKGIDLDALGIAVDPKELRDDSRLPVLTKAEVAIAEFTKDAILAAVVIGPSDNVIGPK